MSLENEKLLLAAMIHTRKLFPELERVNFKNSDHWRIYKTIMDMRDNGEEINPVSIAVRVEQGDTNAYAKMNDIMGHLAHTDSKYILQDGQWAAKSMLNETIREQIIGAAKDPSSDYRDIIGIAQGMAHRSLRSGFSFRESVEKLKNEMQNQEYYQLGFSFLDRLCRGFRRGELVVFMARPGVGKTFALMNILHYLAKSKKRMSFFSLEMPASSVTERIIQIKNEITLDFISEDYIAENMTDDFLVFWDSVTFHYGVYSVAEMADSVMKSGSEIAFIDYLGLIKSARANVSSYERISQIMIDLKTMAKEKNCLVILAIQLSRQAESGQVDVALHHARDSGQIEELSDFVVGMWRPGLNDDGDEKRKIVMRLLKNKRGELGRRHYVLTSSGRIDKPKLEEAKKNE